MRILLDECLPNQLRHHFPGHDVHSSQWAGLAGLKNGALLLAAELAGYEVFLTVDKGIPHQNRMEGCKIALICIRAASNDLDDLSPKVGEILSLLPEIKAGDVRFVL